MNHYAFDRTTKITPPAKRYFLAYNNFHQWEQAIAKSIEHTAAASATRDGHANVRITDISEAMHDHHIYDVWLDHVYTKEERQHYFTIRHQVDIKIGQEYVKTGKRVPTNRS